MYYFRNNIYYDALRLQCKDIHDPASPPVEDSAGAVADTYKLWTPVIGARGACVSSLQQPVRTRTSRDLAKE